MEYGSTEGISIKVFMNEASALAVKVVVAIVREALLLASLALHCSVSMTYSSVAL